MNRTGILGIEENQVRKILKRYLPRCRWFRDKAEVIGDIEVRDFFPLGGKEEFFVLVIETVFSSGRRSIYSLPLFFPSRLPRGFFKSAAAGRMRAGRRTGYLCDAFYSKEFHGLVWKLFSKKRTVAGEKGGLLFSRKYSRAAGLPKAFEIDILKKEQSNSSAVYGGRYFIKWYRGLEEINPEAEMLRYLSVAGFKNSPVLRGEIVLAVKNRSIVQGIFQEFIPAEQNAWEYFLNGIGKLSVKKPAEKGGAAYKGLLRNISLIGQRTAALHAVFARRSADVRFSPSRMDPGYRRQLYLSIKEKTERVRAMLKKFKKPEVFEGDFDKLASAALEETEKILGKNPGGMRIRVHGDYHLGQLLFTGRDFFIIDFEGEPARSGEERGVKHSPLRDVAGMLRSFHYAAHAAHFKQRKGRSASVEEQESVDALYRSMAERFLYAYGQEMKLSESLPDTEIKTAELLRIYMIEKALYEIEYELNSRPSWVFIPILGLKSILRK
ncbi:MAG TPA: hypothetical protein VJC03_06860 [bacterium]|nr:hypothetical protein [bacterium]